MFRRQVWGRLRLGVAGCGEVFERYHLPALTQSRHWDLVSICDPLEARRDVVRKTFPRTLAFASFQEFLDRSPLDAVLITTPPITHCSLARQALMKGLHVLVEKPMALSLREARLMGEAALHAHRTLWIGFSRRFRRPYVNLKRALAGRSRHRIQAMYFELSSDPTRWNPVTRYLGNGSVGSGVLEDLASHQLDLLPWLLDLPARAVKAEYLTPPKTGSERVKYEVEFDNGLVAHCEAGHGPGYSEVLEVTWNDRRFVVDAGQRLELRWTGQNRLRPWHALNAAGKAMVRLLFREPNLVLESFERQLSAFAAAVRGENPSSQGADARSGLRTVIATQACWKSLQSHGSWQALADPEEVP